MFSIAYLVYKKGATCKRKPLPSDNKKNYECQSNPNCRFRSATSSGVIT